MPHLPDGHVVVECRESFRILPNGDLPRTPAGEPHDLGNQVGPGWTILPNDTCSVTEAAARDLVEAGRARRVE